LAVLQTSRRGAYSLRAAATVLGVSTQPVRDWIRLGWLKRDGPRQQISRSELRACVQKLKLRATRFDPDGYCQRIELNRKIPSSPWRKIFHADFDWPKNRDELSPPELARLIGCHPSLINKAIRSRRLAAKRKTEGRWVITRWHWQRRYQFQTF
jgi:transposase